MKEEQFLKKTYEITKITPKKINIEEYLNNMKKTTKNYIVIRKKSPKKINTEDLLNDMNEKKIPRTQKMLQMIIIKKIQ